MADQSTTGLTRWILAIEPAGGWTFAHEAGFGRWAREAAEQPGCAGAEMEVIAPEAHIAHTGRPDLSRFVALLSLWAPDPSVVAAACESARAHGLARVVTFPVARCTLRYPFARSWADGEQTPGLKKSTFWQAGPDFGPAWADRYERHAQIARDHHSSAWQYRQNLLGEHDDPGRWDAVSELWWPTTDDLVERFYNSPESKAAVREDTVFVGRAMPIVTTHTVLRTAPDYMPGAAS